MAGLPAWSGGFGKHQNDPLLAQRRQRHGLPQLPGPGGDGQDAFLADRAVIANHGQNTVTAIRQGHAADGADADIGGPFLTGVTHRDLNPRRRHRRRRRPVATLQVADDNQTGTAFAGIQPGQCLLQTFLGTAGQITGSITGHSGADCRR